MSPRDAFLICAQFSGILVIKPGFCSDPLHDGRRGPCPAVRVVVLQMVKGKSGSLGPATRFMGASPKQQKHLCGQYPVARTTTPTVA